MLELFERIADVELRTLISEVFDSAFDPFLAGRVEPIRGECGASQ